MDRSVHVLVLLLGNGTHDIMISLVLVQHPKEVSDVPTVVVCGSLPLLGKEVDLGSWER